MTHKEKIYSYISSEEYLPLTFDEMRISLDVPDTEINELRAVLDELVRDGKIFITKKKRYASCEKNLMYAGTLRCNSRKKFGFVSADNSDDDIYIAPDRLGTAIDGDRVLVKILKKGSGRREGTVCGILERANTTVSAVVTDNFCAIPDNPGIFAKIKLTELQDARPGDRVLAEITDYTQKGDIVGIVKSVLGSANDLKTYTEAIIFEHGLKQNFDDETLREARSFPGEIPKEEFDKRRDFTGDTVFTIDGDSARDFDDAVSIKSLPGGGYELGVHIADVTHYVKKGTALDREALCRGTSVYLPDRVIPMLPTELSNGLCSLNPHVDRLTLSVIMEINDRGEVISHNITKGIIRSRARMTYNDVAAILNGDNALREKYRAISDDLDKMHKLSRLLAKKREKRGSINFDFPESEILLGADGRPKDVFKAERNEAHMMIEEFMLAANETVAEFAFWAELPFIYRVHDEPASEKIDVFRKFIGSLGLTIRGKELHAKDLQQILAKIRGTEFELPVAAHMLRSLMKAEYRAECDGHFGLAAKYYCHFTSPIRRYPDLAIHRILKEYLSGGDVMNYKSAVCGIAEHSSAAEQNSVLCERDVRDLFKTAYIQDFIGADFKAKISGITKFGIFAELDNTVEGLIRLEEINDDYYEYDEEKQVIVGQRHGKIFRVGDDIEIEVTGADLQSRRIDFALCGLRGKRRKTHSAPKKRRKFVNKHKKYGRGRKNG